jgi:hypothetical protein
LGKSAAFSLIYFLIIQVFSFIFFTVLTLDERPGATKKTKRTVIHKRDDAVDDVATVEGGRS